MPETRIENDDSLLLMAQPVRVGRLDDLYSLFENQFFNGTMVLEKFIDLTLRCSFEFTNYPFDRQICKILVIFLTQKLCSNEILTGDRSVFKHWERTFGT